MTQPITVGPGSTVRNGEIKLLSRLGLGGFGEVFLAQTAQGLKAVKVVETSTWKENEYRVFNTMLMNEASFLSTLQHPGLPRSAGFFAEGSRYFLVMDWFKGHTLEQHVERCGPLDFDELFGLIGDLVEVLDYLHRRCEGVVVFGDLKPANILRTAPATFGLVDLGLVSRQGTKFSSKIAVFSPSFSAPERARGGESHLLHDIFSLGSTVFFALSGKEPTLGMGEKEKERILRGRFVQGSHDWGKESLHCLKKLMVLVLAAMDRDPDGRPRSILPFKELWQRTKETRLKEMQGRKDGSVDEIVRLLYEKKSD